MLPANQNLPKSVSAPICKRMKKEKQIKNKKTA